MVIWSLAKKEFRLLLRDWRAALILVAMPLLFILVLGLLLGESFGQKPDDRIRVMIVDRDEGTGLFPGRTWAQEVRKDLSETADIRIEVLYTREEAERLVRDHRQAAVLIFEQGFSDKINQCSFLADGINPFHRDGVYLGVSEPAAMLGVHRQARQAVSAAATPRQVRREYSERRSGRAVGAVCVVGAPASTTGLRRE